MNKVDPSSRASVPLGTSAYSELFGETRSIRREDALAREQWFARLPSPHRADLVFELDALLKGVTAFANPRNHPGPTKRTTPVVAQDFREQLVFATEGLERIIEVGRALLPEDRERARLFQQFMESVAPPAPAIVSDKQDALTPERSLLLLRNALANYHEIAGGVARLSRVTFRLFHAVLITTEREIARSPFFAPLPALEFRAESDRIEDQQIIDMTTAVPSEAARNLVAVTFLSLFRFLRYVDLAEATMRRPDDPTVRGTAYFVLATLRADARALTDHLRHHGGRLLAEGYERNIFRIHAREVGRRYDNLLADGRRMVDVKAALNAVAANLRLELRRSFEHDLETPEKAPSIEALRTGVLTVASNLRPALQNAILFLAKSLGGQLDEVGVFEDVAARRNLSERLRRDVWMFQQIVRAFIDKARATKATEIPWSGNSPLQFVREFLRYFRSMGVPLLRAADYPRVDAFMQLMGRLEESDQVDPGRLAQAIVEAQQFQDFLAELVEMIGAREELTNTKFDKRSAAQALKLYLGGAD